MRGLARYVSEKGGAGSCVKGWSKNTVKKGWRSVEKTYTNNKEGGEKSEMGRRSSDSVKEWLEDPRV